MSSFLCFICHSTVNEDTDEETREKYREVVGMNCYQHYEKLCPDSHLCHICCHVLNRLWLFRSVCLKRSLEYPVLFSEKGTLNLQRNYLELHTICVEDTCEHFKSRNLNSKFYHFTFFDKQFDSNEKEIETNKYVELYEDRDFDDFLAPKFSQINNENINLQNCDENPKTGFDDNAFNDRTSIDDERSCDEYEENETHNLDMQNEQNGELKYNDNDEQYNDDNDNDYSTNLDVTENSDQIQNEEKHKKKKSKSNKIQKKFEKILLSIEEQKAELEGNRRSKKYIEAEFKCSNCALGFLFKDTYQAHMMRHEESNGEHRCNICTLRFANPAVLRSHKGLHGERYRCLNCSLFVRKRQRTAHVKDCYGIVADEAACHLCGRVFKDSNGVQQHLKRYHRSANSSRSYSCSVCGQRFTDHAAVRTHMIKHITKKFPCSECSSTFSSPYTLRQHQRKHSAHPHAAVACGTCGTTHSHNKHITKKFPCSECSSTFSSPYTLRQHQRKHSAHPHAAVACGTCGTTYNCRKSLLAHVRNVHLRDRETKRRAPSRRPRPARKPEAPAICHLCGATFKGNSKLNRHLREVCEKNRLEDELSSYYTQDIGV